MAINDRLRYARERANLTGARVAELTGIGASTISEFEHGKREPNLSQLQKLALAYRRSVPFFLGEGPLPSEVVLWRERPEERAGEIESSFIRFCEQYHNLEIWCEDHRPAYLPPATGTADRFSYRQAKLLAKQVRDHLQLGDRPGQTLKRVLEEVCGIKVFHVDFEPSGAAASTLSDSFGPAVLLNANNRRWRRNFDLAHELFHLLTWQVFRGTNSATSVEASEGEEKLANCFASHLLMPDEAVRLAIDEHEKGGKVSFEDLFDIAREFDVSIEALIWRVHFLLRTQNDTDRTRQEVERAKQLLPLLEERDSDAPPRWPARYHALAVKALRHGDISMGRFAEYLNISRREATRYVQEEATDGEEVQVTPS